LENGSQELNVRRSQFIGNGIAHAASGCGRRYDQAFDNRQLDGATIKGGRQLPAKPNALVGTPALFL